MTIAVQPLTKQERAAHRCAYCAKGLLPTGHGTRRILIKSYGAALERIETIEPEEQLVAFKTNRRVVRVQRSYLYKHDDDGRVISRRCNRIDLTFMPDEPWQWGDGGTFCSKQCGWFFAHSAHRAGYRIKAKEPAKV